jgi:NAD(P)-dependent dehydrogenase (short-subunit alcohol dehydrogenase family)
MAGRLTGKLAVVTGAGSRGPGVGNGKAVVIPFAREGAKVLAVDVVPARSEGTVARIAAEGGIASAFAADVTDRAACDRIVADEEGDAARPSARGGSRGCPGW